MYTIDYLKTLHADYVEWDTDPGSLIWPEDTYYLIDNLSDDDFKELAELEEDVDFVEAIRDHIQDYLDIGTVKSFKLKDPVGNILCESDDHYYTSETAPCGAAKKVTSNDSENVSILAPQNSKL